MPAVKKIKLIAKLSSPPTPTLTPPLTPPHGAVTHLQYANQYRNESDKLGGSEEKPINSEEKPIKLNSNGNPQWVFNGYIYEVKGFYTDDEVRLLILEDFDKERRYFEKLSVKFNQNSNDKPSLDRPRIPENVRVEVWRRDSGKCARCGSREKLEYDHIVPISRGGSNTARNIELLCEKCNRSKSNNVV